MLYIFFFYAKYGPVEIDNFLQFKVLRGGFWSEVKFERSRTLADAQNETLVLSRNPWIQHFRSNSDNEGVGSGAHTEINCTSEQEIDIGRKRQGEESCGEAASSSQLPSCCTHTCHEDSLRSSTGTSHCQLSFSFSSVRIYINLC